VVLIRNTLALDLLWASQALLADVAAGSNIEQIGPLHPLRFDADDALVDPAGDDQPAVSSQD